MHIFTRYARFFNACFANSLPLFVALSSLLQILICFWLDQSSQKQIKICMFEIMSDARVWF